MIIKANPLKNGRKLGNYLIAESADQKVAILDQRGTLLDANTEGLPAVLNAWEKEALAVTKGEKALYNMKIRLAPGETLERDQWFKIVDTVERKLKLMDHPRVVVAHYLKGEPHLHVVYSRLDRERCRLRSMSFDGKHWFDTARALEKEFGLRELSSAPRRDRNGNHNTRSVEHRMAKESRTTRNALCATVKAAWEASKTGREFQDYLATFGITIKPGDRRDYVVCYQGKAYSPVRLIENVRTAEFRTKMQLDPPRIMEEQSENVPTNNDKQSFESATQTALGKKPVRRKGKNVSHAQAADQFPSKINDIEDLKRDFLRWMNDPRQEQPLLPDITWDIP